MMGIISCEIHNSNHFSDALDLAILGIDLAMQISDANDRKTSSLCPIPAENVVPAAGNTPIHCVPASVRLRLRVGRRFPVKLLLKIDYWLGYRSRYQLLDIGIFLANAHTYYVLFFHTDFLFPRLWTSTSLVYYKIAIMISIW